MTQEERLDFLIAYLMNEKEAYKNLSLPVSIQEKRHLLRGLINMRPPIPSSKDFLTIQDEYLRERLAEKGITKKEDLTPVQRGLYLWQGDITTLAVDAIVNAANSQMLGCFMPCHSCVDNAIHTFSGVQLRWECSRIMADQQKLEPPGRAKITKAYNLPCRYVLHTVGPMISGTVTKKDCELLASCYRSCLELAAVYGIKSVAFCCISTGEFRFPNQLAAEIAIQTVKARQQEAPNKMEVIFNVFKGSDYEIYQRLLR